MTQCNRSDDQGKIAAKHWEGSVMPKYVVLADHTPDICPSSNARTRARAVEGLGPESLPKLMADLELTFAVEPMHLDPSHRTIAIVEGPNVETVVRFVNESGLSQWNTVEVCPTTPISEMMATMNESPIIFD
jgi:hypothetical protein